MKYIFILLITFSYGFCNAKPQVLKVFISSEYVNSKYISIKDKDNHLFIEFTRVDNRHTIVNDTNNFLVIKRKYLLDSKSDTIAIYKKNRIYLKDLSEYVDVVKLRHGWSYFFDGKEILSILYSLNNERKMYELTISYNTLDNITLNVLQLAIASFDKNVIMEYKEDNFINTIVLVIILLNTI
ncbi:MAG: hypothetical protein WCO63_01685 [Bacteroidota bacterium]